MRKVSSEVIELFRDVREADSPRLGFSLFLVATCGGYLVTELSHFLSGAPAVEWTGVGIAAVSGVVGISMVSKTVALGRARREARLLADREADEALLRLASRSRQRGGPEGPRLQEPPVE